MQEPVLAEAMQASRRQLTRKPARRMFHTIVARRGEFQLDIAFMQYEQSRRYIEANHGMRCMLVAIEVATRYGYAVPMPNKSASSVLVAFETFYSQAEAKQIEAESALSPVQTLTTDDGSEFTNTQWQQLMQDRGIRQFIKEPGNRFGLAVVDRFIRTLKTWLEDWQIEHDTLDWVNALPHVLERYNSRYMPSLGSTPELLRAAPVLSQAVHDDGVRRGEQAAARYEQFQVGDTVRIRLEPQQQPRARAHKGIAKGVQRWSNAVYRIVSSSGFSFELQDTAGRPALRTYRQHELMKVPDSSVDVPDLFAGVAREARRARRLQREGIE